MIVRDEMQLIRCTAKLRKEMGLAQAELSESDPDASLLDQWHSNLVHINRRKCVLFVNDKTLFNFIVPNVSRARIRALDEMFRSHLGAALSAESFAEEFVEWILADYSEISFGKSNDRSVLGSMNDLAFQYEIRLSGVSTVEHRPELTTLIQDLNRMPMKKGADYIFPAEEMRKLYQSAGWPGNPSQAA